MHPEDVEDLVAYSPRTLALFLRAPIPQWRCAVARAMASNEFHHPDAEWRGVSLPLAAVAVNEPNEAAGDAAFCALQTAPHLSVEEGRRLLIFAQTAQPGARRRSLVRFVDESFEGTTGDVDQLLQQWAESDNVEDRRDALVLGNVVRPDDAGLIGLLRDVLTCGEIRSHDTLSVGLRLLDGNKDLLASMLRGADHERALALRGVWNLVCDGDRPTPPELAEDVESAAAAFLTSQDVDLARISRRLLVRSQGGRRRLVNALNVLRTRAQSAVLEQIWREVRSSDRAKDPVRFNAEETDRLVALLDSPAPSVRSAAAKLLAYGVLSANHGSLRSARAVSTGRPHKPFPDGYGPQDPRQRELYYDVLRDDTGSTDVLGLAFACAVSKPIEEDVYLIDAALRRACIQHKTPTSGIVVDALELLFNRFPNHPSVGTLALDVVFATAGDQHPCGLAAQRFLKSYQNGRLLPKVVDRYRSKPLVEQSLRYVLPLVYAAYQNDGAHVDQSAWSEFFTDCVRMYCVPWATDPTAQLGELTPKNVAANLENSVVIELLDKFVWYTLNSRDYRPLMYSWPYLYRLPDYETILAEQLRRALNGPSLSLRLNALTLLTRLNGALTVLNPEISQQLAHDDEDVKCAAVVAVAARGINNPTVLNRLLLYTCQTRGSRLRASCLRALMKLDPPRAHNLANEYCSDQDVCMRVLSANHRRKTAH